MSIKNILFIVPPKVHLLDINGPAHIFYEAKEQGAAIDLHFVSLNNESEIESSAGLYFSKLTPYDRFELTENDFVFVPGIDYLQLSDVDFLTDCSPFFKWLKKQFSNQVGICSVCTGAFLLAEAGLLNGKSCTTHWKYLSRFRNKYPNVEVKKDRLFVDSDNLYTSAGVSSGIDLALYLLESQFGAKFASDIAKEVLIYFRRTESDPQLSVFLQYRNHLDTRVHRAQDYVAQHMQSSFTTEEVAESVHMSVRNLTRLFKKTTGITIGAYLEKLRVEKAIHLLADQNKVDFVALKCGLKSPNQLRSLLKKHKGILPADVSTLV